jgi:hypothetical protein
VFSPGGALVFSPAAQPKASPGKPDTIKFLKPPEGRPFRALTLDRISSTGG